MNDDAATLREKAEDYRRLARASNNRSTFFELLDVAAHLEALALQQEATQEEPRTDHEAA